MVPVPLGAYEPVTLFAPDQVLLAASRFEFEEVMSDKKARRWVSAPS